MKNLTKRDLLFFFAGIMAMLVIEVIYDWDSFKQGLTKGYNPANGKQEQTK